MRPVRAFLARHIDVDFVLYHDPIVDHVHLLGGGEIGCSTLDISPLPAATTAAASPVPAWSLVRTVLPLAVKYGGAECRFGINTLRWPTDMTEGLILRHIAALLRLLRMIEFQFWQMMR